MLRFLTAVLGLCLLAVVPVAANDVNLPDWATPPPSSISRNNTPPPQEAAAPGLPGPPSMPTSSGLALLALAGGALAYRKLRSSN